MIDSQVKAYLDRLVPPETLVLAVAVSGGADSICLCLLLTEWAKLKGIKIVALTVDHLLRPESTAEAQKVNSWLNQLGIEHHILSWKKDSFPKNIQESARNARYNLLLNWCKINGVNCLALGHNLDDQCETILQRLAHHSGAIGLSGIQMARLVGDILLIRPLLGYTRKQIIDHLNMKNQEWIEDPSNKNCDYTRIRIRTKMQHYSQYSLTTPRVSEFQKKMKQYRQRIENDIDAFTLHYVHIFETGYCVIDQLELLKLSDEKISYVISKYVQELSGNKYPPGKDKLDLILEKLKAGLTHTSHGCLITRFKGQILICRELSAIKQQEQDEPLWDNRFEVLAPIDHGFTIKPLGKNWLYFKDNEILKSLPASVRPTLPSIWQKERLLSIPHLDYHVSSDAEFKIKPLFFKGYKKI